MRIARTDHGWIHKFVHAVGGHQQLGVLEFDGHSVAGENVGNIHLKDTPDEAAFSAVRDARDATLPLPKLMLAALQINIRGGRKPDAESNGRSYLKIPLDYFQAR